MFAEDEAELLTAAASSPEDLESMVDRRVSGLPLEQIVGWAEFCGLRIAVEPGVFVPRRRTEFLVEQASALVSPGGVVVDLCCGTGAIGVATVAGMSEFSLYAADIDPAAVRCARRNVEPVGGQVFEGDLYDALPPEIRGRVDVLVVNAPYVPTDDIGMMPPEARDHEARVALDGGSDGLEVHRRVAADASAWLKPGGHVLIETSVRQAASTQRLLADAGLTTRVEHSEEVDGTVAIGRRAVSFGDDADQSVRRGRS
ncbi:release factor glutamine methyltransferase [Kutzneria kofuensis]|uniref:peptide chain release factor N(5)-glutamine methyltransferase n=1 Tax=Kutzneria kofuensis TaxID=103725 RepID=A0A7W9KS09_9PSEU|nr:release factor glutamine methyltransferase [Kutzneria kofuensis]